MKSIVNELAAEITKRFTDEGQLIAAGWAAFQCLVASKHQHIPAHQQIRLAYLSGAQHLWGSIFANLDPDEEPTEQDMRRMAMVEQEMERIYGELQDFFMPAKGRS